MSGFTAEELEMARGAIASTIRKYEKARETLLAKEPPRVGQAGRIARNLEALYAASAMVSGGAVECAGEERAAAGRTLEALTRQVEKMLPKFQPGTPQHTLAVRRVRAFRMALALLNAEGDGGEKSVLDK